jgi:gluconolactonase
MNDHAESRPTESIEAASHAAPSVPRRLFLAASAASLTAAKLASADEYGADAAPVRYPDARLLTHDARGKKLMLGNSPIQRLYHSKQMLWAEGPAWNGSGRYLVWSDIPNNVQHRWIEDDGHVSIIRNPANNSNGNTFDTHGRQISFEHLTRSVARYEMDGTRTVLADSFEGKPLNAPNDGVVHPNGDIWFTDPGYGALMDYEGALSETGSVQPHQKEAVYRIEASTGKVFKLTDEIAKPNGICFSPDYKKVYVADTGASHYPDAAKNIKVWDVVDAKSVKNGKEFASMSLTMADGESKAGFADGIRCDVAGNVWASAGWVGQGYDGVHVFAPEDGARIAQILLPEICSNVCFGGSKRNRLFMTGSQSLYAVYVNTKGAHFC